MWTRISDRLRSPVSGAPLKLHIFKHELVDLDSTYRQLGDKLGISDNDLCEFVQDGVLICDEDQTWYPISMGLAVLLPYETPLQKEFAQKYAGQLDKIAPDCRPSSLSPVAGEQFVMNSFSEEWKNYDYDGVIWELSYEDHKRRLAVELGLNDGQSSVNGPFLEVGCGLGITTSHAQHLLNNDAFGVDLSLASLSATQHFSSNPFLHFIQASAFYLPFEGNLFNTIYSRGVLHHTHSTEKAFRNVTKFCSTGGAVYLWVYGPDSIDSSFLRRALYQIEKIVRPRLSKNPEAAPSRIFLSLASVAYVVFNRLRRLRNSDIQRLTLKRAIHAARDRFTPEFAYRHSPDEVVSWFNDIGFSEIVQIDWKSVPAADYDDYGRNVGVLGREKC
jgi:SAM-dependent methyltransferase/uncharacterized protein YbaR (Trm112 family)